MAAAEPAALQRIDQWLWFARIAKSRTLAQALIARGKVRLNRLKIDKTSTIVRPGDVLTLSLGPRVISIEILAIGLRRGPASEAQGLYRNLMAKQPGASSEDYRSKSVPAAAAPARQAVRPEGSGRPTKLERRAIDRLKGRD